MKRYIRSDKYDELEVAEQRFSSRGTLSNDKSGKVPLIFRLVKFPPESLVLDYGGGSMRSEMVANEYLAQFDCEDVVYDLYNQTPEERQNALDRIRVNDGADVAICSNLLNVIAEESARMVALRNIQKLTKPGAPVYFTMYEGSDKEAGSGIGRQTGKDQYQNNRRTADYLEEIRRIFPDATRKGKLISATNQ